MRNHALYEGSDEHEIRCSRCLCVFRVPDQDCDDSEWDESMDYADVDKDCDAQLVKHVMRS